MRKIQKVSLVVWVWNFRRVVFFFLILLFSHFAEAQPTVFDPSFQVGSGADGPVNYVVVQDDGRILVGGEFTTIAGHTNAYLARLDNDGQFDLSFGAGTDGLVYYMVKQPDGKILVAGAFNKLQGVERHGIGRLLTNGAVDPDFNANQVFATNVTIVSCGIQPDGKVLVCPGWTTMPAVVRLDETGELDSTWVGTNVFGGEGYAVAEVYAVMPRNDGSILAG